MNMRGTNSRWTAVLITTLTALAVSAGAQQNQNQGQTNQNQAQPNQAQTQQQNAPQQQQPQQKKSFWQKMRDAAQQGQNTLQQGTNTVQQGRGTVQQSGQQVQNGMQQIQNGGQQGMQPGMQPMQPGVQQGVPQGLPQDGSAAFPSGQPSGAFSGGGAGAGACGPSCFDAGPFQANVSQMTMSQEGGWHVIRMNIQFHNTTNQPLIIAYHDGSMVMVDNNGNTYIPAGGNPGQLQGMGIDRGNQTDSQFVLGPGQTGSALFSVARGRGPTSPIGTGYSYNFTIDELQLQNGAMAIPVRTYNLNFPTLAPGVSNAAFTSGAAPAGGVVAGGKASSVGAASAAAARAPQRTVAAQPGVQGQRAVTANPSAAVPNQQQRMVNTRPNAGTPPRPATQPVLNNAAIRTPVNTPRAAAPATPPAKPIPATKPTTTTPAKKPANAQTTTTTTK
jgi:hypothetical protein